MQAGAFTALLLCLCASGAQAKALTDQEKRRTHVPSIRTATKCIADRVMWSLPRNYGPSDVLTGVSRGIKDCREPVDRMVAEHDRLYGHGTGRKFLTGPYIQGLIRAVMEHYKEVGDPAGAAICNSSHIILTPMDEPYGFFLMIDPKRKEMPWVLRVDETGENFIFRLWRRKGLDRDLLISADTSGPQKLLAGEVTIYADKKGNIGSIKVEKLWDAFNRYRMLNSQEPEGSDIPPDGQWVRTTCETIEEIVPKEAGPVSKAQIERGTIQTRLSSLP